MNKNFIRIVQISDTHLFKDDQTFLGVKPHESFERVMELVKKDEYPADLILHTGDMSQDETGEAYLYLAEQIKLMQIPAYFVPGNHDDFDLQKKLLSNEISYQKHIVLDNWQLILLNSQKIGETAGELSESELIFLENSLKSHANHYAIIAFHHPPVRTGRPEIDQKMLLNTGPLADVLTKFSQVKLLLCGHIHQDFFQKFAGVNFYSCPSTWVQFNRHTEEFTLEDLPQGYRWINLYADGSYETGITRLENYVGTYIRNPPKY